MGHAKTATTKKGRATGRPSRISAARLDKLIEEATVDCYNESEQAMGLYTMLEEHLQVPFETRVLGVDVKVERLDVTEAGEIVAVCSCGRTRQAIPLLEIPLPKPPPRGVEWIEAYRR